MKYLVFLLTIALFVAPCMATDPDPEPEPDPVLSEVAEEFKTKAVDFLGLQESDGTWSFGSDSRFKDISDLDANVLAAGFEAMLADMYVDPASASNDLGFDPTGYFNQIDTKVNSMIDEINGHTATSSEKADAKARYLKEVANDRVKGYFQDLHDAKVAADNGDPFVVPDTSDYVEDFDTMRNLYKDELDMLVNGASASVTFDPSKHLDTAVGRGARAVKIQVDWGGVNNHKWINWNLYKIISRARTRFAGNTTARKDLDALLNMWPQESEVTAPEGGYSDQNIYNNSGHYAGSPSWKQQQGGSYGSEFMVNEYGEMMGSDDVESGSFYDNQMKSDAPLFSAKSDGTWNNRGLGYKYNNGTNTTIKLITNGRAYKIQETIYTSPIVLDMDGDGKIEASRGQWMPHNFTGAKVVEFDMNGDGFVDLTEWVGPNDGLLVDYKGGTVTGKDLFGSSDSRFMHGYEKLSLLDKNKDKMLDAKEMENLSVWQDKNGNAKVDEGEMQTIKELGITSISLDHDSKFVSKFVQAGNTKTMWDWFPALLRVKRQN